MSQATCATLNTTMSAVQNRAQPEQARARIDSQPANTAIVIPMSASHSGPSWRLSASAQPAIPAAVTSRRSIPSRAFDTRTRAHTQNATAAAISGPLGFTELPTKSTIGVIANRTPTAMTLGRAVRRSAVIVVARNAAMINTLRKRMRYTTPDPG